MSNERKRIFSNRVEGEWLILGGVEWNYQIFHAGSDELTRHSHQEGENVQIRRVLRIGALFEWEFNWIIHDDPMDGGSRYIVARYQGTAETLEQAAQQALDYQPQPLEAAGMRWYPHVFLNNWLTNAPTGKAEIFLAGHETYLWDVEFPMLNQIAGIEFPWHEKRLRGQAGSLEEAACAVAEAHEMFMASLYAMLPQTDSRFDAFEAGKAAGRAEARLKILEALS